MTIMIIEAAASANLFLVAACSAPSAFGYRLLFKFAPMSLGSYLGSLALARFMGWPI
ncbi:hypothetical protein EV667_2003 [Ancylobacter aquaticus]|uniref:Uncharacterized protein n=1 Tax=Ancylobacter aquaticus TaxID=100 RepID=A0A4R1HYW6_ANCAQ|nr:hypothetical protein EV667_2003 [Ancylobacter aquaticus]